MKSIFTISILPLPHPKKVKYKYSRLRFPITFLLLLDSAKSLYNFSLTRIQFTYIEVTSLFLQVTYVAIYCSRFNTSLCTLNRIRYYPPYYPTSIISLHTKMDAHLCIKVHRVVRELETNMKDSLWQTLWKPHMFLYSWFIPNSEVF